MERTMIMNDNPTPPEWDLILSAAQKNDVERIRLLIVRHGIDPSHANHVGQSGLHIAALWGNVEALRIFLRFKAEVNANNRITGALPLHCAVQSNKGTLERRLACIDLLLLNGADRSLCDFYEKTPFDYVESVGYAGVEREALSRRLKPKDPDIFSAIQRLQLDLLRELVARDKNLVKSKFRGLTPLLRLVMDFLKLVEDEEESAQRSDNNQADSDNNDAKLIFLNMLQVLLEAGSDPNTVYDASASNSEAAATSLVAQMGGGPPAGDSNISKEEPLLQILKALCNAYRFNYDPNDPQSTTTVDVLEKSAHLLAESGADVSSVAYTNLLLESARRGELKMIQLYIEKVKLDPNGHGRQGMTALQFAARGGRTDAVKYLLDCPDIDINATDDRGTTPLDAARVNNKQEIVQLLESFSKK